MISNTQNPIRRAFAPESITAARVLRNRVGRARRVQLLVLSALMCFAVWGVVSFSEPAEAQTTRSATIEIDAPATVVKGNDAEFTVTTSGIASSIASYYTVTITESGHLGESDQCSGNVYEIYSPRSGNNRDHDLDLWGCTPGSTTITATLTFQGPDDLESSTIGSDTDTTRVVLPPPPEPAEFSVGTHPTFNSWVQLTWTRGSGINHYDIYRRESGEAGWDDVGTYTLARSTLNFAVSLPDCGTTYEFRVGATGDGETYSRTEVFSGSESISYDCPPPVISITALGGVREIDEGDNANFKLTSHILLTSAITVRVQVTEDGDYLERTAPTEVPMSAGSRTMTFSMRTEDDGNDEEDGEITAVIQSGTGYEVGNASSASIDVRDDDLPPPPDNVMVERGSTRGRNAVIIDWDTVSVADGYQVQRRVGTTGRFRGVSPLGSGGSSSAAPEDDFEADCDKVTYFRVASTQRNHPEPGNSDYSSPVQSELCTAPPPSGFTTTTVDEYSIKATWRALTGIANYKVEFRRSGSNTWETAGSDGDSIAPAATSYTIGNLNCGTQYYARISAKGDNALYTTGFGETSSGTVNAFTLVCPTIAISTPEPDAADAEEVENFGVRVIEGESASFVLTPSKVVSKPLLVRAAVTQSGTYVASTQLAGSAPYRTFTIPVNATSHTISIPTVNDTTQEASGSVTVSLKPSAGLYVLGTATEESMTIDDNDLPLVQQPPNVTATSVQINPGLVRVEWTKHTGTAFYRIQKRVTPNGDWEYDGRNTQEQLRSTTIGGYASVECGRVYEIRVAPFGNGRTTRAAKGPVSSTVTYTSALCPLAPSPANLAVHTSPAPTKTTTSLSWNAVDDVVSYQLERFEENDANDLTDDEWVLADASADTITTTTYTATGLTCGQEHEFRVKARGSGHPWRATPGHPSTTRTGSTAQCDYVSISLSQPSGHIRVFEGSTAVFTLTASRHFEVETAVGYTVAPAGALPAGTTLTPVSFPAATDSVTLRVPIADTSSSDGRRAVTVSLVDGTGYEVSPTGGSASVVVDDDEPTLPAAPTAVTVRAVDEDYTLARISWTSVSGVPFHQVQRRVGTTGSFMDDVSNGDDPRLLAVPDGSPDATVDSPIVCGTTYQFRVIAFGDGESYRASASRESDSATVTFTRDCPRAPAPTNLSVSNTEKYSLTLTWPAVPDAAAYKLEREDTDADEWVSAGTGADAITGLTYTVTGLQCGTAYSFRVSANGDGHPYSTTFGEVFELPNDEETDACPIVSISIPDFTPTNLSPVRNYRIFEGDTATFTLTTDEEFQANVTMNVDITHGDADISGTIPQTITFPANSATTTLSLSSIDNTTEEGRELIAVTLEAGTGYRVSSLAGNASIPVDDNDLDRAPAPDVTIASSQPNPTSVRLDWTRGTNIARYRVEKRLPQSSNAVERQWAFAGSYTILGRTIGFDASTTCGLAHEYRAIPVGDGEVWKLADGHESSTLSYTGACPAADAPTGLRSGVTTEYSVALRWTSVYGAEFYKIERSGDGTSGWAAVSADDDTVAASATKYTSIGLACGVYHYFRISARGDGSPRLATYGDPSTTLGPVRTEACPTVSIARVTSPIFEDTDATFTVTLNPAVAIELPITIAVTQQGSFIDGTEPTEFRMRANTGTAELIVPIDDDETAEPRGSVTVTIAANANLYTLNANAASARIVIEDDDLPQAPPPADLAVVAVTTTPTFYRVEWTRADDVDQYQVEYRIAGKSSWSNFGTYTIRSTIGVSNSLLCGTTYEFRARAKGDGMTRLARFGDWLNPPLSFTVPDCLGVSAPTNLAASNRQLTSIDLSWSPVTGAVEYKVEHRKQSADMWEETLVAAPGVSSNAITPTSTTNPSATLTGLICRTNYSVRVSARGNGRLYSTEFGGPTNVLETSTEQSYATCADRTPSFGSETIAKLTLTVDTTMTSAKLPAATGGDAPLEYAISPDLPAGLTFDVNNRQVSGTPTTVSCGAMYNYTVTDGDPTNPDTDTLSFTIAVQEEDHQQVAFRVDSMDDWTYSVTTNSTALQLPSAVGGFGPLRYEITPALPAGMTFDTNRLLIYGVPSATMAATQYTYTVRNRAGCTGSDSDSITFNITIPAAPPLPATPTSVTGLSITSDNGAGTLTVSWSADDNPGYQIRQYVLRTTNYVSLPRGNFTVTCGGKIATICPADTTSATISGYTADGWYDLLITGHNGLSASTAPRYADIESARLTFASDPEPEFDHATIDSRVFVKDREIDTIRLPAATGGNGRLEYTLTPNLPAGLSFNPITRAVSGTPTSTFGPTEFSYTVTDSDAANRDAVSIRFRIEVADTEITVTDLRSRVSKDDEVAFTVEATNTPELGSTKIVVEAFGGANDTSSATMTDIGFNNDCSTITETSTVAVDVASHTSMFTLNACDAQHNGGGIVKAYLINNGVQITDVVEVDVLVSPAVAISGLRSPVYEGEEISFTADVSDIAKARSYSLKLTAYGAAGTTSSTTDGDIGFNSDCSVVEQTTAFTADSGASPTHSEAYTLYVCDSQYNDGGVVTITLVDANDNIVAGDWFYLEAKPISLHITTTNPFPVTVEAGADSTDEDVTLTAVMDAPIDTTFSYYQWRIQPPGANPCGDSTSEDSSTYNLTSSVSTSKSVWVIVKERSTDLDDCFVSEEITITWDLGETMDLILDTLTSDLLNPPATRSDPLPGTPSLTFLAAQAQLISCISPPSQTRTATSFSTFGQVVSEASPGIQSTFSNCANQITDVWTASAASFETTIAELRDLGGTPTQTERAVSEFLNTPAGIGFEKDMRSATLLAGAADKYIPLASTLLSNNSSTSDTTSTSLQRAAVQGMGCIPEPDEDAADDMTTHLTSPDHKYFVLNCLIRDTDHQFWLDLADKNNELQRARYRTAISNVAYLSTSDFHCSIPGANVIERGLTLLARRFLRPYVREWADSLYINIDSPGEAAACLKHDLTWGSLPKFESPNSATVSHDLDLAWNPRNKFLADSIFLLDNICDSGSSLSRETCLDNNEDFWFYLGSNIYYALLVALGYGEDVTRAHLVAEENHYNWPVTDSTRAHVIGSPLYMQCDLPHPNIVDPSLSVEGGNWVLRAAVVGTCSDTVFDSIAVCYSFFRDASAEETPCQHGTKQPDGKWAFPIFDGMPWGHESIWLRKIEYSPPGRLYGNSMYEIRYEFELPYHSFGS